MMSTAILLNFIGPQYLCAKEEEQQPSNSWEKLCKAVDSGRLKDGRSIGVGSFDDLAEVIQELVKSSTGQAISVIIEKPEVELAFPISIELKKGSLDSALEQVASAVGMIYYIDRYSLVFEVGIKRDFFSLEIKALDVELSSPYRCQSFYKNGPNRQVIVGEDGTVLVAGVDESWVAGFAEGVKAVANHRK